MGQWKDKLEIKILQGILDDTVKIIVWLKDASRLGKNKTFLALCH